MLGTISHSSISIHSLLRLSICTVSGKYTSGSVPSAVPLPFRYAYIIPLLLALSTGEC